MCDALEFSSTERQHVFFFFFLSPGKQMSFLVQWINPKQECALTRPEVPNLWVTQYTLIEEVLRSFKGSNNTMKKNAPLVPHSKIILAKCA